jgi:recombination protein RecA
MDAELRKKLGIGAASKAEVPEVPASGPAEAVAAVRGKKG